MYTTLVKNTPIRSGSEATVTCCRIAGFALLSFYFLLVPNLKLLYIESVVLKSHGGNFKIAMKIGPQHSRPSLLLKKRLHQLLICQTYKKTLEARNLLVKMKDLMLLF